MLRWTGQGRVSQHTAFQQPHVQDIELEHYHTTTMAQAAPDHQPRPLLRIGLVPEHFSAPLQLAAADGTFAKHGIDVELVTCPGGTGEV